MITIRQGICSTWICSRADVVILYLETGSNDMLKPNLEKSSETRLSRRFPRFRSSRMETCESGEDQRVQPQLTRSIFTSCLPR